MTDTLATLGTEQATQPADYANGAEGAGFGKAARVGETPRGILPADRDPSQAWFWTERWQAMEREVDEDIAAGRYTTYTSMQAFIDDLCPDGEPDPTAPPTGDECDCEECR